MRKVFDVTRLKLMQKSNQCYWQTNAYIRILHFT